MSIKNSAEDVGRVGHETIGAEVLRSLGFSSNVCQLVKSHVAAKRFVLLILSTYPPCSTLTRYLTAVDNSYHNSLSSASQKTLKFQGGPFQGEELLAFDRDPLRGEMVNLRLWDGRAKVPGIEDSTPRPMSYLDRIVAHLEGGDV